MLLVRVGTLAGGLHLASKSSLRKLPPHLLSMLLLNMIRVKAPMKGLPSEQATTSCFKKRPEKVDRPTRAVIFETARAPTKDHANTEGRVELHEPPRTPGRHPVEAQSMGEANRSYPDWNRGDADITRWEPPIR